MKFVASSKLKFICFVLQICGVFGQDANNRTEPCMTVDHDTLQCTSIPITIPLNITRVLVVEFDAITNSDDSDIHVYSNMFSDNSWKNVKFLSLIRNIEMETRRVKLAENCFSHLTNLKELRISLRDPVFYDGTFYGLPALSALNLSGCTTTKQLELEKSLQSAKSVPNLRYLDISNFGNALTYKDITLDSNFFSVMFSKPIKGINLSSNYIKSIDGAALSRYCGELEYINISGSVLMLYNGSSVPLCTSLGILDISHGLERVSQKLPLKKVLRRDHIYTGNPDDAVQFSTIDEIRANGILKSLNVSGGFMLNVFNYMLQWTGVTLRDNGITRLDVRLNIPALNITRLDLSSNKIEFINPLFLNSSWQILDFLELSDNKLYLMVLEDETSFSRISSSYPNLRHIGLATNQLSKIPERMFVNNHLLEVIDLSHNSISSFNLRFSRNGRLRELYLHNNNIHNLDAYSRKCLDSLHVINIHTGGIGPNVTMNSNPISCSTCGDHELVDWTLQSMVIVHSGRHAISCIKSKDITEKINNGTAQRLLDVCAQDAHRRDMIIFVATFTCSVVVLIVLVACFLRRHLITKRHKQEMQDTIDLIRRGAREYAVFLSFCSEDEEFVNGQVFDQLQNILQELTGTVRTIVSTGDRNFRIGRWIADETVNLLKQSSVVVIVVSNAYCQSNHCQMEFEQAYDLRKPIMLMFKGNVDQNIMWPVMRDLYNRYTRIVWEFVDEEYKLKTTWQNIGTSILEMLGNP